METQATTYRHGREQKNYIPTRIYNDAEADTRRLPEAPEDDRPPGPEVFGPMSALGGTAS